MRIAFYGASGTGKTTLARYVAERYGLAENPVGSRSVAKAMGFESPYDVDQAGRRGEFQHRLLLEKKEWEREHETFVTDRTTLDNLVYTMMHDVRAIDGNFYESVFSGMRRYTHLIYCPVGVFQSLDADPVRKTDDVYHKLYDAVLQGFRDETVPLWRLDLWTPDIEKRKVDIDDLIRRSNRFTSVTSGWRTS
jgi:hypothetical protein